MKRTISLILVFAIMFSVPFTVLADIYAEGETSVFFFAEEYEITEIDEIFEVTEETAEADVSGDMAFVGETAAGSVFDGAMTLDKLGLGSVLDIIEKAFAGFVEGIPGAVGEFAADAILKQIFPDRENEEIKDMLNAILANQQEMIKELKAVQTQITKSEVDDIINKVIFACENSNIASNYYQALYEIDSKGLTGDELAKARIAALMNGISDPSNANAQIDEYCELLHALLTTNYYITLPGGTTKTDNILMVYDYYMSTCFKWEHQAYDSIDSFKSYLLGTYIHAAAMERLSLEARLKVCNEANKTTRGKYETSNLEARIKMLDAELHGSKTAPYTATGVEEVMNREKNAHPRSSEARHFWYNGADITFCASAQKNEMPKERDDGGYFEKNNGFEHFYFKSNKILMDFWRPLWTFSGVSGATCVTAAELNTITSAYGNSIALSDILFDEKEGNIDLPAGLTKASAMRLVLFPDSSNPVHEYRDFYDWAASLSHIYMSSIESSRTGMSDINKKQLLCSYRPKSSNKNDGIQQERKPNYIVLGTIKNDEFVPEEKAVELPYREENSDDDSYTAAASGTYASDSNGVQTVTWTFDAYGWHAVSENGTALTGWVKAFNPYAGTGQADCSWFYFDERGVMLTGWQWIRGADGKLCCYYLNPVSDGMLGACMLNGSTPDGYTVNRNGVWTVNGTVQSRER